MKEWIDVADTAVKIGLGALITGFYMQQKIKLSYKNDLQKYAIDNKIRKLEKISQNLEIYFNAVDGYAAKVSGIMRHKKRENSENQPFSETQKSGLKRKNKDYELSFKNKRYAFSDLRLLQADNIVIALEKYLNRAKTLRDDIIFNKTIPTYEEVKIYKKDIKALKKNVYQEISKLYNEFLEPNIG